MDYKSIIESKYNRNSWMQLLSDIFGKRAEFWQSQKMIKDLDHTVAQWAVQLGKITLQDGNIIAVYEVELAGSVQLERNRAAIRNLLCTHWRSQGCAGAFMFCQRKNESALRFSYVSEAWTFKEDGSYVKEATEPRRYTYYLGEGHRSRTAIDQFTKLKSSDFTLKALTKAFSVEAISDMFFDGYKKQYEDIILYITGKKMVKVGGKWEEKQMGEPCAEIMSEFARFENPEKSVRDYVKRLMGRLVFIQFLQKKGWMGVPAGDSWSGGDKEFLQHLFINTPYKDTFVDDVLEPLFNDLNTRRGEDLVSSEKVGVNIKVPYLNGGLFERSAEDDTTFPLPARYMQSLIVDFFAAYNFTIDENDPNDAEVGVDAEMLGRIFENLLEDNKDKGAFYTPKEIVQYMCRESLIAYLQTETGIDESRLRKFVTEHSAKDCLSSAECGQVLLKIHNVKICDPAIGSGAFPMGLLNELVACRIALGEHQRKKANIKRDIIQNNIYGVDIERGAVDIARLRFWLSLIVDEDDPEALPNMDFKIVQGNSLITTFNGKYLNLEENKSQVFQQVIKKEKEHLHQLQKDYFAAIGERKMLLGIDIKTAILNIVSAQFGFELRKAALEQAVQEDELFGLKTKDIANKIQLPQDVQDAIAFGASLRQRLNDETIPVEERAKIELNFFDWKIMFADVFDSKGGFDIVIGNPPYVTYKGKQRVNISEDLFNALLCKYTNSAEYKVNSYALFVEAGLNLVQKHGITSFIIPSTILQNEYLKKIRRFLLQEHQILHIVSFGNKVFDAVTDSIILQSQEGKCSVSNMSFARVNDLSFKNLQLKVINTDIWNKESNNFVIDLKTNEHDSSLFSTMEKSSLQLNDFYSVYVGIVANGIKKFLSNSKDSDRHKPYLQGKHINHYETKFDSLYINFIKEELHSNTDESVYELKEKILVRKTGNVLLATLDTNQYYTDQSIYNLYLRKNKKYNNYVLVGILNSDLMNYYYNKKLITNADVFPYIKGVHIKSFPLPTLCSSLEHEISELVKRILELKCKKLGFEASVLITKVNYLIYVLYDLDYKDTMIVNPDFPMTEAEYNEFKQQHQDK